MNAITAGKHQTIVFMWGSQLGKTDIQLNAIGYFTQHEPSPIMMVQPTLELARDFSKDRLTPMYRDSKSLSKLITKDKSRDSSNTVLYKSYPGGRINIAGANSPRSLASKPIRVVLADEIDGYPASSGVEGDPVSLVSVRQETFPDRVRILVSTPTIKGTSRIESFYEDSTQEEWCVPCPSCETHQPFKWAQLIFDYDDKSRQCTSANFACMHCGSLHSELEWKQDYENRGKWIPQKENAHTRGFHLSALASTFVTWKHVVNKFMKAKREGPESLKTFVNTTLAESWEEQGDQLEEDDLFNRREDYTDVDVPDGVLLMTAAVDVQDDRFEVEVLGWGSGKESWGIKYQVLYGDLKQSQVWNDLDAFLSRTWTNKDGKRFGIACTCMDSGGHFTTEVYRFCAAREARKIYAIKGQGTDPGQYVPFLNGHSRTPREKAVLFRLGVDEGKANVVSRLRIMEVGPGYCHFPKDRGYNEQYFQGLTAEKLVTRFRMGIPYQVWVKVRQRNEPLDLRVYNTAALEILNPRLDVEQVARQQQVVTKTKTAARPAVSKRSSIW